jgi:hypothetical protein
MMHVTGLWLGGFGIVAVAFESLGGAKKKRETPPRRVDLDQPVKDRFDPEFVEARGYASRSVWKSICTRSIVKRI